MTQEIYRGELDRGGCAYQLHVSVSVQGGDARHIDELVEAEGLGAADLVRAAAAHRVRMRHATHTTINDKSASLVLDTAAPPIRKKGQA